MNATKLPPLDDEARHGPDGTAETPCASQPNPPFDWQVLLLRYLPQPPGPAPGGCTHVIKRLVAR